MHKTTTDPQQQSVLRQFVALQHMSGDNALRVIIDLPRKLLVNASLATFVISSSA